MRTSRCYVAILLGVLGLFGCAGSMPRAYVDGTVDPGLRIGIIPLANYTERQDASDRVVPMLAVEMARQRGVLVVDQGRVEEVLSVEPWLLLDRLPPDLIDKFGAAMEADALLVGSVLSFGYREIDGGSIPEFSLALRLLEVPGGRCLWSGTQSRAGTDRESVFGMGRVDNLENLAIDAVRELVETFPKPNRTPSHPEASQKAEQEK